MAEFQFYNYVDPGLKRSILAQQLDEADAYSLRSCMTVADPPKIDKEDTNAEDRKKSDGSSCQ